MPKLTRTECVDRDAHAEEITKLLAIIAKKGGKRRGDVVIAYEEDISVYAVRMWLTRPIPQHHWKTVAKLSGYSVDDIQKLTMKYFRVV
jgi:hypothetical protein